MSRKQFIKSHGATCKNWNWSWSFINANERIIIFGAWDKNTEGITALILDDTWERNYAGKKSPGYPEARENIRLIEEEGYVLKTFPIIYSDARKNENGLGPSKIKDFGRTLTPKILKRIGNAWYASDGIASLSIPEEVEQPQRYIEGASQYVSINAYERNLKARAECIKYYGTTCVVCGFNFEETYGTIGAGIIHVHHLVPLAEIKKEYVVDPIKDLRPVCPNCHAIIHSTQPALSIEQLNTHLGRKRNA